MSTTPKPVTVENAITALLGALDIDPTEVQYLEIHRQGRLRIYGIDRSVRTRTIAAFADKTEEEK